MIPQNVFGRGEGDLVHLVLTKNSMKVTMISLTQLLQDYLIIAEKAELRKLY